MDAGENWSVVYTSPVSGSGNPTDNMFDVMDRLLFTRDTVYLVDVGAGAIYMTTNGGTSWNRIYDTQWRYRFIKVNPYRPNQLWFGGEGWIFNPILFESTDYGSTWDQVIVDDVFQGDNACHTLAFYPDDMNTWYVPGEGKIVKSTNAGLTWSVIHENSFYNFDMAVSPVRSQTLYVNGGPYLFKSENRGISWDTLEHSGYGTSLSILSDVEVVHRNGTDIVVIAGSFGVHRYDNSITGVILAPKGLPSSFKLSQNFPNPFNPLTVIRFQLPVQSNVSLKIYNLLGREVRTLVDRIEGPGERFVQWDGRDNTVRTVNSGAYFCHVEALATTRTIMMIMLK